MSNRANKGAISRYTTVGDIAVNARRFFKRALLPLVVLVSLGTAYIAYTGRPGASAFAMISAGTCLVVWLWAQSGSGLPLVPVMAIQNLAIYGLPIALGHDVLGHYPEKEIAEAGIEVLVFSVSMIAAWKMGIKTMKSSGSYSYVLDDVHRGGMAGLSRMGFVLIGAATAYRILQSVSLIDFVFNALPGGSYPIIVALLTAVSACGFFMVSLGFGSGEMSPGGKAAFWALLAVNSLMSAGAFLLSGAALNLIAVAIGLFWGTGRLPWRYLLFVTMALSFLNVGKVDMRQRYWAQEDAPEKDSGLAELPARYLEWIQVSFEAMTAQSETGTSTLEKPTIKKNQTLLDRLDTLQNLLYVIASMDESHVEPLHGQTYSLIPPLLIPRLFWPDKPRTHEGQVMLNVHFGRQDLASTFTTYVAWGLLPEAYGNFGPIAGALALGLALGALFAWVENWSAPKLVISLEGFLVFDLLLNLMNSFEMVASVLVTSTFQSLVTIAIACIPFVHRRKSKPPEPAPE